VEALAFKVGCSAGVGLGRVLPSVDFDDELVPGSSGSRRCRVQRAFGDGTWRLGRLLSGRATIAFQRRSRRDEGGARDPL